MHQAGSCAARHGVDRAHPAITPGSFREVFGTDASVRQGDPNSPRHQFSCLSSEFAVSQVGAVTRPAEWPEFGSAACGPEVSKSQRLVQVCDAVRIVVIWTYAECPAVFTASWLLSGGSHRRASLAPPGDGAVKNTRLISQLNRMCPPTSNRPPVARLPSYACDVTENRGPDYR